MNKLLKTAHITQTELAKSVGVSKRLVSYWCNGGRRPNVFMAKKIAETLHITTDEVINAIAASEHSGENNDSRKN